MKFYAARQAIFNRRLNVVAYELFYRESESNTFPVGVDPHVATSRLISRTHFNNGFKQYCSGKPALVNFSESSLLSQIPHSLPRDQIVIEILEDVTPSDRVLQEVRELFRAGYKIALDDFVYRTEWNRFLQLARLIKFDIQRTPLASIKPLIENIKKQFPKTRILAEKVETKEEYEQAKALGFDFFQGYFFCKPEMLEGTDAQARHAVLLATYNLVLREEFDLNKVAELYKHDVSLTYKLLRFINSGLFPIVSPISSVHQALRYIGTEETRKFVLMLFTAEELNSKPRELINMAILRAKFCEEVAEKHRSGLGDQAFLVGLFSFIENIMDRPMEEVLEQIALDPVLKDILMQQPDTKGSPLTIILNTAKYYEKGSWHHSGMEAKKLNLNYDDLAGAYQTAIKLVDRYNQIDREPLR
ncbi:HDOD domain-containing protein [Neiella sp. HB171785]|uniref:HDOD domain-containing protein n=1 Tax=Neiella litorisoli TaxID=2771431 RepID=A0A8J6QMQ9_9GAMM|nr:HDOD domain-containing protein [Neiella litorisoli]